jgi:hypothetical protein
MAVGSLFAGPSPLIVAVVFVLAIAAAATVLWMFRGLLVDSRSDDRSGELAGTARAAEENTDAGWVEI